MRYHVFKKVVNSSKQDKEGETKFYVFGTHIFIIYWNCSSVPDIVFELIYGLYRENHAGHIVFIPLMTRV